MTYVNNQQQHTHNYVYEYFLYRLRVFFQNLLKKLQKFIFGGCPFDKQVKTSPFLSILRTQKIVTFPRKRSATSFIYFIYF